jgi:hypothetical protein
MDSVRFGRALGLGARSAAKAVMMAADAAASPNPAARPGQSAVRGVAQAVSQSVLQTGAKARQTQAGLARGGKRFGEAAWGPFVRLSGVLWLELTGVFFGLFLLTALMSAWKLRGSLRDTGLNHAAHERLLWSIGMALVFGYFSLSSFIRAARRERRQ